MSEQMWCRTNKRHWEGGPTKLWKVQKSMARIKCVVGERTRAYKAKKALEDSMKAREEGMMEGGLDDGLSNDEGGFVGGKEEFYQVPAGDVSEDGSARESEAADNAVEEKERLRSDVGRESDVGKTREP